MKDNMYMLLIRQAYSILHDNNFFKDNLYLIQTDWEGLSEYNYKRLDNDLKAIRQDLSKIILTFTIIDKTYSKYQQSGLYEFSSFSLENELGIYIEYLFFKYRVILEYIQDILDICITHRLNDSELKEYSKKKKYEKFEYLLEYISNNNQKNSVLNIKWFQSLRMDRNALVHKGASCLVILDNNHLLFKVWAIDELEKEEIELDTFYTNDNNFIYYNRYWGLQIARMIIFIKTFFNFLMHIGDLTDEMKDTLDWINSKYFDDRKYNRDERQDILFKILEKAMKE